MKKLIALLCFLAMSSAKADDKGGYQQFAVQSQDKNGVEQEYLTGYIPNALQYKGSMFRIFDGTKGATAFDPIPKELDLRPYSQRVRRQQCGDCWAQGGMTMFEALISLRDKISIYGSVQQVIDCSNYGGCGGGQISIKDYEKGVILESDYPYKGFNQKCKNSGLERHQKSEGSFFLDSLTLESMQHAMMEMGPLEICGSASALKNGGWVKSPGGGNTNHCYAALGWLYGPDHGHPECLTWLIVRNSWGGDWGTDGGYGYYCYDKSTTKTMVATEGAGSIYHASCTPQPVALAGEDKKILLAPGFPHSTMIGTKAIADTNYQWMPTEGLSDPTSAVTKASPLKSTVYTLTATTKCGVAKSSPLKVQVFKEHMSGRVEEEK